MKARSFLIGFSSGTNTFWFAKVILSSIVFLIVPIVVSAQGPCICKDKADLLNQLNKANAAFNSLQQYLKTLKQTDLADEIPPVPSGNRLTWRQIIDGTAYDAGYDVEDVNAGIMIVKIDSVTCGSTVTAGTACLKSLAEKVSRSLNATCASSNKLKSQVALDYVLKLSDSYREEIAEIIKYLRALPKECPLNDWFGTINVSEEIRNDSTETRKGTVTTMNDKTVRTGRIVLMGSEETNSYSSFWTVSGGSKFSSETNSASPCSGGLGKKGPDMAWNGGMTRTVDYSGGNPATTQVDIGDPEDNRSQISFALAQVNGQGKGKQREWRTDPCPDPKPIDKTFDMDIPDFVLSAGRIPPFRAVYFPAGDIEKLSGSETINMYPYPVPGQSHTIRVSYNLYRLKRR